MLLTKTSCHQFLAWVHLAGDTGHTKALYGVCGPFGDFRKVCNVSQKPRKEVKTECQLSGIGCGNHQGSVNGVSQIIRGFGFDAHLCQQTQLWGEWLHTGTNGVFQHFNPKRAVSTYVPSDFGAAAPVDGAPNKCICGERVSTVWTLKTCNTYLGLYQPIFFLRHKPHWFSQPDIVGTSHSRIGVPSLGAGCGSGMPHSSGGDLHSQRYPSQFLTDTPWIWVPPTLYLHPLTILEMASSYPSLQEFCSASLQVFLSGGFSVIQL